MTNLEELHLEGCEKLVKLHPSIRMLKRLVVLNMRDCKRLKKFLSELETDYFQILILSGCLKVDKLPKVLGKIKTLLELHIDRTSIAELPSFVPSLTNLESLSFGQHLNNRSRWWTSCPFRLLNKQQHPQRSVMSSLAGLHMLKSLNFSYCNLVQTPDAIGGLSHLEVLNLKGNNFTSFPVSFCQLPQLYKLELDGFKKLEVFSEHPPNLYYIGACDCTSLREMLGAFNHAVMINIR
ncbi:NB-ARC domains-containing protein [Artemisia annua]|uniref:NB-ARC domains-containing protein n=1 Tax=Artemisia annua TaxID=35608 RepID=A0A2U1M099_ARTAN|nr:NB-ARC domains-containing protein [Artemisia annua]